MKLRLTANRLLSKGARNTTNGRYQLRLDELCKIFGGAMSVWSVTQFVRGPWLTIMYHEF